MYHGWDLKDQELQPCMMTDLLFFWEKGGPGGCSLAKAPWKEKLEGGAVPHQLALPPGDAGAEAAKAGQSPLEMSRIAPGGCLAQLQLACNKAIYISSLRKRFIKTHTNPSSAAALKGTRKALFTSITGNGTHRNKKKSRWQLCPQCSRYTHTHPPTWCSTAAFAGVVVSQIRLFRDEDHPCLADRAAFCRHSCCYNICLF